MRVFHFVKPPSRPTDEKGSYRRSATHSLGNTSCSPHMHRQPNLYCMHMTQRIVMTRLHTPVALFSRTPQCTVHGKEPVAVRSGNLTIVNNQGTGRRGSRARANDFIPNRATFVTPFVLFLPRRNMIKDAEAEVRRETR